jgi:hypothetical protein
MAIKRQRLAAKRTAHRRASARYVRSCSRPIDFHADTAENRLGHGFINIWTRSLAPEDIDRLIDAYGNLPGECGSWLFNAKFTSVAPA